MECIIKDSKNRSRAHEHTHKQNTCVHVFETFQVGWINPDSLGPDMPGEREREQKIGFYTDFQVKTTALIVRTLFGFLEKSELSNIHSQIQIE